MMVITTALIILMSPQTAVRIEFVLCHGYQYVHIVSGSNAPSCPSYCIPEVLFCQMLNIASFNISIRQVKFWVLTL